MLILDIERIDVTITKTGIGRRDGEILSAGPYIVSFARMSLASTCQGTLYRRRACKIGYEFRLTPNSEPQEINKKSIATWRPALLMNNGKIWFLCDGKAPSMTERDNPVRVFWITRDPVKLLVPRRSFSTPLSLPLSLSLDSFSFIFPSYLLVVRMQIHDANSLPNRLEISN